MPRLTVLLPVVGILMVPAFAAPPNVLLICVDDLKPAIHAYGDELAVTPNLDALAARGVRFDRAYCNQAVCGPSRYNLLLGSRSTSTGVYSFAQDPRDAFPDAVTLPQYFMRHGYTAESIGKVFHVGHGTYDDPASWSKPPLHDKVIEYLLPESTGGGRLTREEALFGNVESAIPIRELPRGSAWEAVDVPDNAYADGRVATEAARRLTEFKRTGERFFLAVGFARPHLPFVAPKKYWDLYDRARMPLSRNPNPPTGSPAYAMKGLIEINQFAQVPEQPPLGEELQRTLVHGYYAGVSYADAQIGRVLEALAREGLAENTVVLVWGDHGYAFGNHGDWTKHSNYEEVNRIPVIIAGPGVARGSPTPALFETVDIYPTLAELAGLEAPTGPQPIDGKNQVPVLKDPQGTRVKDYVYHAYPRPRPKFGGEWLGRAIRTERYRFVDWRPFGPSDAKPDHELFDYDSDPLETTNLAAQHPELVERFSQILAREPAPKEPLERRPLRMGN